MKPVHLTDAGLPSSYLPFSPAVRFGDLLFVSGQASVDDRGQIVSGTFEEEMRRSVDNLRRILEGAGSDLAHVLQVRSYLRDESVLDDYNRFYRELFPQPYPARTTITGVLGSSLWFEIDCIAAVRT